MAFFILTLRPSFSSNDGSSCLSSFIISRPSLRISTAFLIVIINLSNSGGLSVKSYAPFFRASTAVGTSPNAVTMMTGTLVSIFLISFIVSIPFILGILRSISTASGRCLLNSFIAANPSPASATENPSSWSTSLTMRLRSLSSSTINTLSIYCHLTKYYQGVPDPLQITADKPQTLFRGPAQTLPLYVLYAVPLYHKRSKDRDPFPSRSLLS